MNKKQKRQLAEIVDFAHSFLSPQSGLASPVRLGLVHLAADHIANSDEAGIAWDKRKPDIGYSFKILMELIDDFERYFTENDWKEIKASLENGGKDE